MNYWEQKKLGDLPDFVELDIEEMRKLLREYEVYDGLIHAIRMVGRARLLSEEDVMVLLAFHALQARDRMEKMYLEYLGLCNRPMLILSSDLDESISDNSHS